jgi:hypothetical protein
MTHGHWFWFFLTVAGIIWYSTITVYVSFKGYADILKMLHELRPPKDKSPNAPPKE